MGYPARRVNGRTPLFAVEFRIRCPLRSDHKRIDHMSNRQKLSVALWWNMLRAAREPATAELQRLWQEGVASGPGRFTSIDQIKKEARRRLREAR